MAYLAEHRIGIESRLTSNSADHHGGELRPSIPSASSWPPVY